MKLLSVPINWVQILSFLVLIQCSQQVTTPNELITIDDAPYMASYGYFQGKIFE